MVPIPMLRPDKIRIARPVTSQTIGDSEIESGAMWEADRSTARKGRVSGLCQAW